MGSHQPIRKVVTPEIPDKLYFRIGDVARLCEVPAYVLRFWETEFPQLKPNKGGSGQRLYRKRDVEMALRIKSLLYDQGYTIPGARQVFKSEARAKDVGPAPAEEQVLPSRAAAERPLAGVRPASSSVAGEELRSARLHVLREDLQALLSVLSAPVGALSIAAGASQPSLKPQALRPRLVSAAEETASPRSASRPVLRPSLFSRPSPSEDQADLFAPAPAPSE